MKNTLLLFLLGITLSSTNAQQQTKSKKILEKVKTESNKAAKFIGELFKIQGPTPKNYIPVSRSTFITNNQFKSLPIQKGVKPELKLQLLYPRAEFGKGNVAIQVGDDKYYKYLDTISEKNIEYIKITNGDKECIVKKYILTKKVSVKRNIALLLDHSGSMGNERADILQKAVIDAVFNNQSPDNTYSIFKFDHTIKLTVSSNNFDVIKNSLYPLKGLDDFGGGTGIEDAIETAVDYLILDTVSKSKIVVLFTDGVNNSKISSTALNDILRKAEQNNINIVTIGYGTLIDEAFLTQIAKISGGALYRIYNKNEFDLLFDNVLFELRSLQYIDFSPCMFGEDLKLTVKLKLPDTSIISTTIFKTPIKKGYNIDLNINYANNSFAIDGIYFPEIDKLAEFMKDEQGVKILVSGHTDKVGDDNSNLVLSQKRAEGVKSYLIKKGINADRISTVGFGETKPAYGYSGKEESSFLNRRIEVEILSNKK